MAWSGPSRVLGWIREMNVQLQSCIFLSRTEVTVVVKTHGKGSR